MILIKWGDGYVSGDNLGIGWYDMCELYYQIAWVRRVSGPLSNCLGPLRLRLGQRLGLGIVFQMYNLKC